MGTALVQLKIMPESPNTNLEELKEKAKNKISEIQGEITNFEEQDIAFGLKALIAFIRLDETIDTSKIEDSVNEIPEVSSVDIIDHRRAL